MNNISIFVRSEEIINVDIPKNKEPSNLNPTEGMLATTQEEVDFKISRTSIQPSNNNTPSLLSIENVTCKPKEVLSVEAKETFKVVNDSLKLSQNYSILNNALHYVHLKLIELEYQSKSVRSDLLDSCMGRIKPSIYITAYSCLVFNLMRANGYEGEFDLITNILDKLSDFRKKFLSRDFEAGLINRFQKYPDRAVRAKKIIDAFILPLDEISRVFQLIQELFNLPKNNFVNSSGMKEDLNFNVIEKEFLSYRDCMTIILEYAHFKIVGSKKGVCSLDSVHNFFNLGLKLVDLKNVNKEKLNKDICSLMCKKNEIKITANKYAADNKVGLDMGVVDYHEVVVNILNSLESSVNILLLNKFHVSEIASIELSLICEELKDFANENTLELIFNSIKQISSSLSIGSLEDVSFPKMRVMLNKISHFTEYLEKDSKRNFFKPIEKFMDSEKTLGKWVCVKQIFEYLKKEIIDLKKSMVICNVEFQKTINQTAFVSLDEIDQVALSIQEFKDVLSPFLFVFFKLPYTLDEYLIEGKDGVFKKPKVNSKKAVIDTQVDIKNFFNINFSKAYATFSKPEIMESPQPCVIQIELPQEKVAKSKKLISKPTIILKAEPKIFQTNRVDDILEELKERGWVKDRYHGSHLIFKKDRETFTVPTNHSRIKNGTLGALNRQYTEKEERINDHNHAL